MPAAPLVTATPGDLLQALRRCHDGLAALVSGLGQDGLTRPSYCDDWNVAQVLSHLGSGSEIAAARIAAARDGTPAPDAQDMHAIWAVWDARSPRQQADGWAEAVPRFLAGVEALDERQRQRLRPKFFLGEVELAVFLAFRLVEHALHAWDVRVSFEPGAQVDPGEARLLVDLLPFGAGLVDAEVLKRLAPAQLEVDTSDPSQRYLLELGDEARLRPTQGAAAAAGGALRLPAEALLRMFFGRLDPEHTPAATSARGRPSLDELRLLYPGLN